MQLIVLGLNHKTAPVEIRERFNFSQDRTVRVLRRLRNNDNLNEAVLLSTCNRTELYMVLEDPAAGLHFIRTLLRHLAGEQYKPDYFYNLTGINCVRHLFKVASSLDSLIIGEGQILSQIKNAYHLSRSCGMTDTLFNTLFNRAIAVGKRLYFIYFEHNETLVKQINVQVGVQRHLQLAATVELFQKEM